MFEINRMFQKSKIHHDWNTFLVPDEPPQNVQCSPLTPESLRMSWDPPPIQSHHGTILGYKIHYKKVNPVSGKIYFLTTR